MKYLTQKDKAMADAKVQLREATRSRNVAAITRAVKAEKDALAMTATVQCTHCNQEFEQGDELIIFAAVILRKRRQPDGSVKTEWIIERDLDSPVHLAFCPACDDALGVDNYIRIR
jgi:hypothetical protein